MPFMQRAQGMGGMPGGMGGMPGGMGGMGGQRGGMGGLPGGMGGFGGQRADGRHGWQPRRDTAGATQQGGDAGRYWRTPLIGYVPSTSLSSGAQ